MSRAPRQTFPPGGGGGTGPGGGGSRPIRPTIARIPREQPLPQAPPPILRSILWTPEGGLAGGMSENAIFITQTALREISRHVWSEPDNELLGFLLGERRESPETRTRYLLITATTRSSYVIPEASTEVLSEEAWHASHLEARRRRLQLVGWYHSAPFVGTGPALRDTQSHEAHFPEPWQVGMILAPRSDRASGGFFRASSREEAEHFLPFYEVVDDAGLLPDGQKRSVVAWGNYVPDAPPARATQVAILRPKMGAGTIPIVMPAPRPEDVSRNPLSRRRAARRYMMSVRQRRARRRRMVLTTITMLVIAGMAVAAALLLQ